MDTDSARRFALQWEFVIHASSEGEAREALGRLEMHLGVRGTSVRVHGIPDPLPPKRYGLAFLTELQPADMPYCEALLKTLSLASRLGVGWTISDPTPYQDGSVELSGTLAFPLRDAPDHTLASPEIRTGRFTLWDTQPAYANDRMHLRSPLAPARLKESEVIDIARAAFPGAQLWDHARTVEYGSLTIDWKTHNDRPIGKIDAWKIEFAGVQINRPSGGPVGSSVPQPLMTTFVILVDDKAGRCLQGVGR